MTDLTHPAAPMRLSGLSRLWRSEPQLAAAGLFTLLLMLPTGAAALLDTRTLDGVGIWDKPLKFQLSLGIYLLSLSVFAHWLPRGFTDGRIYRLYRASVLVAIGLELAWLMGAAVLGVASHFNSTEIGTMIYRAMGGLAIWLASITLVYGLVILRRGPDHGAPALKEGVGLGLALVLPLTLVTAGFMGVLGSHQVGVGAEVKGLWPLGWARDGGDLRVAHFFGTHALHFVPALALLSVWLFGPKQVWPVRIGAALFVGLVAYTFAEALADRPFLGFLS